MSSSTELALDHVIWTVKINYRLLMSDHFPLTFELDLTLSEYPQVAWPPMPKEKLTPVHLDYSWDNESYTYQQWSQHAVAWLEHTCECTILPKAVWTIKQQNKRPPKTSVYSRRLLRLQRALAEVVLHVPTELKVLSVERKCEPSGGGHG